MRARYTKQIIDITGQRFGRWTVLRLAPPERSPAGVGRTMWWARCDCGIEKVVNGATLRGGDSTGCRRCYLSDDTRGLDQSRRLRDGRTIAGIARATGLKLTTVDRRWRRGWPAWALGVAVGEGPVGMGGSRDIRGRRAS
jgi:hypothetical protein